MGLATLGPPKSMTSFLPLPVSGAPSLASHRHRAHALGQRGIGDIKIDEAGAGDFDFRKQRIGLQMHRDLFRDRARIGFRGLCSRKRAVTLKLREIWPVGRLDRAKLRGESFGGEGAPGARRQFRRQRNHLS
jgi:hypothetical protein